MSDILIQNVCKTFSTKEGEVQALKNVNLSIGSGDIFGIIGMSGAGKSTLVRCMNFLEVPSEGQVLIDGKSLGDFSEKELRKEREKIGMIFQHFNLLMQKNVLENVCFPLYIQGKKKPEARKKALGLLEIVGLAAKGEERASSLPYGHQRKLEIARAMATDPKLLWLDEPAAGRNADESLELVEFIRELKQRFDITILMIEHHMDVVTNLCDACTVLNFGKTLATGTVEEIKKNPEVIAAYLGGDE